MAQLHTNECVSCSTRLLMSSRWLTPTVVARRVTCEDPSISGKGFLDHTLC